MTTEAIENFVTMTLNVIDGEGIENFQPTLVKVTQREIVVMDDIPADVDHRQALCELIGRHDVSGIEYLVAVRTAAFQVVVGHVWPEGEVFQLLDWQGDQWTIAEIGRPSWLVC